MSGDMVVVSAHNAPNVDAWLNRGNGTAAYVYIGLRLPFSSFFSKKAGENLLDAIFSLDLSLNPREETVQKVGRNKRMFSLGV